MSRVGRANFKISSDAPTAHDAVWREGLNREQWDHCYHAMRLEDPNKWRVGLRNAQTAGKEAHAKTWHLMQHIYSSAAGKSSYHYNLQKPVGNVQCYFPSANYTSFSYLPRVIDEGERSYVANSQLFNNGVLGRATEHAYGRTHEEAFHAPGNSKADAGAALSSGNANAHRGLYNEAYLNEGHFNSDAALQNDLRVGRWDLTRSINARSDGIGMGSAVSSGRATRLMNQTYSEGFGASRTNALGGAGAREFNGFRNTRENLNLVQGTVAGDHYASSGKFDMNKTGEATVNAGQTYLSSSAHDPAQQGSAMRHTSAGPFFHPAYESTLTANRVASGPTTALARRVRSNPPKYRTSQQDQPPVRARRTNQPNAPSFQRIMGL